MKKFLLSKSDSFKLKGSKLFILMEITYKTDDDLKANRDILFLRQSMDQYNKINSDHMPDNYKIEELIKHLSDLAEGIGNGFTDTVGSNLYNILNFLGTFYDLLQAPNVYVQILDIFNESNFIENSIEIIVNDHNIRDIIYLFEILVRVFKLIPSPEDDENEEESTEEVFHQIQSKVTEDLLNQIAEIVTNPTNLLPEEKKNTFNFGNVSMGQLFGKTEGIPVEDYNRIQCLGIAAISNLCISRNDLLEYTFCNICKELYQNFIQVKEKHPDKVFEVVRLFCAIMCYINHTFVLEEMIPFADLFIQELNPDEETCFISITGLAECVHALYPIADHLTTTSLYSQLNDILKYKNDKILSNTLILISEIFCHASREAKIELAKYIDWSLINFIINNTEYKITIHTLCKTIPEIINNFSDLLDAIYDSKIIHSIVSICINSNFEMKKTALCSFFDIISYTNTAQTDDLLNNRDLILEINDFIIDVDDQTSYHIVKALSEVVQRGTEISIIKHLYENEFFDIIEKNVEILQDSDNTDLSLAAIDLFDNLQKTKQELQEADETGY